MILLHESTEWLNDAAAEIGAFASKHLALSLNPHKTILQPIERGVDFVGQIIKPWRRVLRRTTFENAMIAISEKTGEDLMRSANSYLGLFRQSGHSHNARVLLARIALRKGHCVDGSFTKVFRKRN
jgi:hypothetical protein